MFIASNSVKTSDPKEKAIFRVSNCPKLGMINDIDLKKSHISVLIGEEGFAVAMWFLSDDPSVVKLLVGGRGVPLGGLVVGIV